MQMEIINIPEVLIRIFSMLDHFEMITTAWILGIESHIIELFADRCITCYKRLQRAAIMDVGPPTTEGLECCSYHCAKLKEKPISPTFYETAFSKTPIGYDDMIPAMLTPILSGANLLPGTNGKIYPQIHYIYNYRAKVKFDIADRQFTVFPDGRQPWQRSKTFRRYVTCPSYGTMLTAVIVGPSPCPPYRAALAANDYEIFVTTNISRIDYSAYYIVKFTDPVTEIYTAHLNSVNVCVYFEDVVNVDIHIIGSWFTDIDGIGSALYKLQYSFRIPDCTISNVAHSIVRCHRDHYDEAKAQENRNHIQQVLEKHI